MTAYNDRDALRYVIKTRDALRSRIDKALAIHTEDDERCTYCKHPDGTGEYESPTWPCPTVAALTGETP